MTSVILKLVLQKRASLTTVTENCLQNNNSIIRGYENNEFEAVIAILKGSEIKQLFGL